MLAEAGIQSVAIATAISNLNGLHRKIRPQYQGKLFGANDSLVKTHYGMPFMNSFPITIWREPSGARKRLIVQ